MIRLMCNIGFEQQPNAANPNRNAILLFPFVADFEASHSWKNLTDTAKIKIPKKVIVRDQSTGADYDLSGRSIIAPGGDNKPFLMRGDKVVVLGGYDFNLEECFTGYVTQVIVKQPIEIICEDNMYRLKQIKAQNITYPASKTFEGIIQDLIDQANAAMTDGTRFTYATPGIQTNIGRFMVRDQTIAQVLDVFRQGFRINSWFRGNELHASALAYLPEDFVFETGSDGKISSASGTNVHNFVFQGNIISDELQYTRKDDVRIGIKAYSVQKELTQAVNKDGTTKSKHSRLEAFVGDTEGEIRTYYSPGATTVAELKAEATARLNRYYYEGFKGSFTTFLQPRVLHGDIVNLIDNVIPERSGSYFVKAVTPSISMQGGRQKIEIDMRVDGNLTVDDINRGV